MPYTQQISRETPACFLFLLDQSTSMEDPFAGDTSTAKETELARVINSWLDNVVVACTKGESEVPYDYFDIGVIGYRTDQEGEPIVESAFSGELSGKDLVSMSEIYANPLEFQEVIQTIVDEETGEIEELPSQMRVWVTPKADGGTPMCSALHKAYYILEDWIKDHPNSFPPIVINISDGESTEGDPLEYAQAIQDLETEDGNVLFFNCHLSMLPAQPILFTNNDEVMPDDHARSLFRISSVLPPSMIERAQGLGYELQPNSRGMVFNADSVTLLKFLDIGTQTARNLR